MLLSYSEFITENIYDDENILTPETMKELQDIILDSINNGTRYAVLDALSLEYYGQL